MVKLGQDATLNRMVWIGLIEKMAFKQIIEVDKGVNLMKFWRKSVLGEINH